MPTTLSDLIGRTVHHIDGASGRVVSVENDGRLKVQFSDGACTAQSVRSLNIDGMPAHEWIFLEELGLEKHFSDEELRQLLEISDEWDDSGVLGPGKEALRREQESRRELRQEHERLKKLEQLRKQQRIKEAIERDRQREELKAARERERREFDERMRAAQQRREAELHKQRRDEHERLTSQRKRWEAERQKLLKKIRALMESDYLSVERYYQSIAKRLDRSDYERLKVEFVKEWVKEHVPSSKSGATITLDDEQAAAIGTVHGHIQIVARAGSGKTTTLVNRSVFLIKHCNISPREILLLAFNRKAAHEVRKRLLISLLPEAEKELERELASRNRNKRGKSQSARRIERTVDLEGEAAAIDDIVARSKVSLPHVMTFHALAYSIVHPEESLLMDADEANGARALSRTVQQVIDDHLRDAKHRNAIRRVMVSHFKEDWERIILGGYDRTVDEFLAYRRSLPRQSLNGDYVKSYGEKIIADFLYEHDVNYKYERNHYWNGENYRPDFTIFTKPSAGLVIEYFGMEGDPDYDRMSREKRIYWKNKPEWELLELTPRDVKERGSKGFRQYLKDLLEERGVVCTELSEEELWSRLKDRAIDRFTGAVKTFVGRCRKQALSVEGLEGRVRNFKDVSDVESQFLRVVRVIYRAYLARLKETGEDDFDGLMQRAAEKVAAGRTAFVRRQVHADLRDLRYVFIDEYQDFSLLFDKLVRAICAENAAVEIFCVGDDWQAINGFAGADLTYFDGFCDRMKEGVRLYVSTNYRSAQRIVKAGNVLMEGRGRVAKAHRAKQGDVLIADLRSFKPEIIEQKIAPGDAITPAVVRLVHAGIQEGRDVVLLSRQNRLPSFVNWGKSAPRAASELESFLEIIRQRLPVDWRGKVSLSTTHKYKGLERDMVIVLDAVARRYPLIHPDWIFQRVLGDSIERVVDEERRLFYVALTRAVDRLVILTDQEEQSPFLEFLRERYDVPMLDWSDYPPPAGEGTQLVVKVGNAARRSGSDTGTFPIKDYLKAADYRWRTTGWQSWQKIVSAEGFSIDALQSELWASAADGVEVRICDETDAMKALYIVEKGRWVCAKSTGNGTRPTGTQSDRWFDF